MPTSMETNGKLEKLYIKNFKSIKRQAFDFSNITIFTGTNSAGKSSVIQAILLYASHCANSNSNAKTLLDEYLDKLDRNNFLRKGEDDFMIGARVGGKNLPIIVNKYPDNYFTYIVDDKNIKNVENIVMKQDDFLKKYQADIVKKFENLSKISAFKNSMAKIRRDHQIFLAKSDIFPKFESNLYYLSANRTGPETQSKIKKSIKSGINGEYIFGIYNSWTGTPNYHFDGDYSKNTIKKLEKELEITRKKISNCENFDDDTDEMIEDYKKRGFESYDDIESYIVDIEMNSIANQTTLWLNYILDLNLSPDTENIDNTSKKVFYENYDLNEKMSPFNLGAGVSYLAKIVILGLSLGKDDVLIVENPEVHLHPKAISKVAKFFAFLAKNDVQIIIETHSEHILNKMRYMIFKSEIPKEFVQIYYRESAKKDFENIRINEKGRYIDENGEICDFPSGFFDSDLDELLEMM